MNTFMAFMEANILAHTQRWDKTFFLFSSVCSSLNGDWPLFLHNLDTFY